jgi:hypothetical protein
VTHTISINGRIVILEVRHNGFQWMAVEDAAYESGCAIGFGDTAQAAVNDWIREQTMRVAA